MVKPKEGFDKTSLVRLWCHEVTASFILLIILSCSVKIGTYLRSGTLHIIALFLRGFHFRNANFEDTFHIIIMYSF